jgi:hypothetical protein
VILDSASSRGNQRACDAGLLPSVAVLVCLLGYGEQSVYA